MCGANLRGSQMNNQLVQTREQFIRHLAKLADDFEKSDSGWQNRDIPSFIEAMSAWLKDCAGYYRNTGEAVDIEKPSWQFVADAFSAATVYE